MPIINYKFAEPYVVESGKKYAPIYCDGEPQLWELGQKSDGLWYAIREAPRRDGTKRPAKLDLLAAAKAVVEEFERDHTVVHSIFDLRDTLRDTPAAPENKT